MRNFLPQCTHQVTEVAQRVSGHLYDALCEAALVADEAGEDGGQAVAGSVQHNSGGGSLYCYLWAAAPCRATGKKVFFFSFSSSLVRLTFNPLHHSVRFSVLVTHDMLLDTCNYGNVL